MLLAFISATVIISAFVVYGFFCIVMEAIIAERIGQ